MPQDSPQGSSDDLAGLSGGSMRVEPSAIPRLVEALQESLDTVGVQIEHAITELRIRPWAGDPVSRSAADEFNRYSTAGGEDALTALCSYRDQLQTAAESLEQASRQYQWIDSDNAGALGGGC
ncbi:hypothetical protein [Saccharopolyspora rectivirgula]|uniref:PE domain-containing protein n=1 Tax=Saccharopolyspora rectivirgula TaxID=28042 RepID=A0A073BEF2_9PSEU|nr:hypothetical protein [Saccharopolyspora rectivirgula]KEI46109.1 hypothetical protein GU90_00195 [Saccharopolyspora rectivirgula]